MNAEQYRQDQINEARGRSTLSPKPGARPPKKVFVAKGHDAILKNMQDTAGKVEITTMGDGSTHVGTLVARDKYTITIQCADGRRYTFYKHAIESFSPLLQVQ